MGALRDAFDSVYRDFTVSGVASSGRHEPTKSDIRGLGVVIEQLLSLAGVSTIYDTSEEGFDATTDGELFLVKGDGVTSFADLYIHDGGSAVPLDISLPSSALVETALEALDALELRTAPFSGLNGDEYAAVPLPPEGGFLWAAGDASRRVGAGLRLDGTWGETPQPDPPYPIIQIFGDSFVQGVGPNYQWWQHFRDMMAAAGDNRYVAEPFGSGGQDASQIAGRLGSRSILVTLAGNTIPASGSVTVTNLTPQIITATTEPPLVGGPQICRLAINPGVWGTLQRNSDGSYTWYRETPGSAIAIPANSAARTDGFFHRKTNVIIAAGRNTANFDLAIIRQEIDAMRRMQTANLDVSLGGIILGFTNASTENPDGSPSGYADESNGTARNTALYAALDDLAFTYGDDFIDVQRYSLSYAIRDLDILHGQGFFAPFYSGGLPAWPTHKAAYAAQDADDIAAGIIPTSLRHDGLHPNTYWAAVIAQLVFRRFRSKRY